MDRAMNADMLERAGYGVTLSRIEELGKKYTKTQEEQDELAILKTICDRYTGNLSLPTPIQLRENDQPLPPNFFAMAYPRLYQAAISPLQPGELAQDPLAPKLPNSPVGDDEQPPPQLVRCPGAPLPDMTKDLPLAFGRIVAISGAVRLDGRVPLPNLQQYQQQSCVRRGKPPVYYSHHAFKSPAPVGSASSQPPAPVPAVARLFPINSTVSVTILDGRRGFVKDAYLLPDGEMLYHVYAERLKDEPISDSLMITCYGSDLDPLASYRKAFTPLDMWWIIGAHECNADANLRKSLSFWTTPASGWPPGSIVSVPLGDSGRQCVKIIKHLPDSGFTTVMFPVLPNNSESGILGNIKTDQILGPSVFWDRSFYPWSPIFKGDSHHHRSSSAAEKPASSKKRAFEGVSDNSSSVELPPLKLSCPAMFPHSTETYPGSSFLRSDIAS